MPETRLGDSHFMLKYGVFYHVTESRNWCSISSEGLVPTSDEIYRQYFENPVVFLCTNKGLPMAKKMFQEGLPDDPHLMVLGVAATAVVGQHCDPDWSFACHIPKDMQLPECLERFGLFVCYNKISPQHIHVHEFQNRARKWQQGAKFEV